MTPLPDKPEIVVLIDENRSVVGMATNVAPIENISVWSTRDLRSFEQDSKGLPFVKIYNGPDKAS